MCPLKAEKIELLHFSTKHFNLGQFCVVEAVAFAYIINNIIWNGTTLKTRTTLYTRS